MIIRDIAIRDFEEVNEIMKEIHSLHVRNRPDLYLDVDEPFPRKQFEEDVENENFISVLAEENHRIMGICFAQMMEKICMVEKRTAYMDVLCVVEKYRKQGIGGMLFHYVQEKVKRMGAERLDLMVWGFNDTAYSFYEKMGMNVQRNILEKKLE